MKISKIVYDFNRFIKNNFDLCKKSIFFLCDSKDTNLVKNILSAPNVKNYEAIEFHSIGIFVGKDNELYKEVKEFIENYEKRELTPVSEEAKEIQEELNFNKIEMVLNRNNEPIYYEIDEFGKKRRVSKKYAELRGFKVY